MVYYLYSTQGQLFTIHMLEHKSREISQILIVFRNTLYNHQNTENVTRYIAICISDRSQIQVYERLM